MNKTVKLLIERMETNPEEFFSSSGRWNWLHVSDFTSLLAEEDKKILREEYQKVRLEEFHAKVLETILNPEDVKGYVIASGVGTIGGASLLSHHVLRDAPLSANINYNSTT